MDFALFGDFLGTFSANFFVLVHGRFPISIRTSYSSPYPETNILERLSITSPHKRLHRHVDHQSRVVRCAMTPRV